MTQRAPTCPLVAAAMLAGRGSLCDRTVALVTTPDMRLNSIEKMLWSVISSWIPAADEMATYKKCFFD